MILSAKDLPNFVRSMVLGACAVGSLASAGCSAPAGDEMGDPLDPIATSEENYTRSNRTIPWRGAPRQANAKSSARFGQIDAVYGADLYHETVCSNGDLCAKQVRGLKVFMHDGEDNTVHAGPIGVTQTSSVTRQVCPAEAPYVTGYRVNVGSGAGFTAIEGLGLRCGSADGATHINLPIVGNNRPLFPDLMSCRQLAADPVLFVGEITMNNDGTGLGASCVTQ